MGMHSCFVWFKKLNSIHCFWLQMFAWLSASQPTTHRQENTDVKMSVEEEFAFSGNLEYWLFLNIRVLCYPFKHSVLILPVCALCFAYAEVCWSSVNVGHQWRFPSTHGLGTVVDCCVCLPRSQWSPWSCLLAASRICLQDCQVQGLKYHSVEPSISMMV